jgi:O-antigen ligase
MVLLIFAGIFICRTWDKVVGSAIIALAAVFLYFTHSKSPFNLLLVVLPLSYLIPRTRSVVLMFMLVAGVAFLINVATLGSVMFPQVKELLTHVMSDPTFTGRDVIWEFGLDHVAQRPWFGFGFEAFWRMPNLVDDWNFMESWGYQASDAHNGYLNLAVTTGLVGLGLTLWWMVAQPFADLRRVLSRDGDRALTTLFVQIWLFSLCLGGFEAVFFSGGKTPWFLMVSSIMGLRLQSLAKTAD